MNSLVSRRRAPRPVAGNQGARLVVGNLDAGVCTVVR
jgi:hypothetical protein